MAHERSTRKTHEENPDQKDYDEAYYEILVDHIKGNVLDIGCGALLFVKKYINNFKVTKVTAIDKHKEDYQANKLTTLYWTCPQPLPNKKYDTIVSTEFIEHITKEQFLNLLFDIKDKLVDNGKFVGSTPNKKVPTTNPYHLYEYTLDELKEILDNHFKEVTIKDTGKDCTVWIVSKPV